MLFSFFLQALALSQVTPLKPPPPPYRADTINVVTDVFCLDSGMDCFGVQHIVQDGVIYERENRIDGDFEVHLVDAPRDLFDHRQLKFRYGASYAISKSKLLKYNKPSSRWQVVLESPRKFSTFEVTFSGQILLFGTRAKPEAEHSNSDKKAEKRDFEEGAQIEIWEMGASEPASTIPYDAADRELAKAVEDIPSNYRTWIYRDWVVFYNTYTGRMGTYDLASKSLKWVTTPWAGLTMEGLRAWENESKEIWDLKKSGQILIDAIDVPPEGGIQFCPDDVSLKVAYWRPYSLSKTEEVRKETNRKPDSKPTVILPRPVSSDTPRGKIGIGTLDLEKSEISQDQFLDPPSGGFFWVNSEGQLVPLEKILKPSKSGSGKKLEPGKTKGSDK